MFEKLDSRQAIAEFNNVFKENRELPALNVQELVFEAPLYERFRVDKVFDLYKLFREGFAKIDGFCVKCGKDSVFKTESKASFPETRPANGIAKQNVPATFVCTRNELHEINIFLEVHAVIRQTIEYEKSRAKVIDHFTGIVSKIGQFPSHADISNGGVKKLVDGLDDLDRREFIRANGLAAHGVNIGAFVYLRRVFERLIDRARKRAGDEVTDADFLKARMQERVAILRNHLPPFMVANSHVYSILSSGIHELEESKCGQMYELMKKSCELMLEQEIEIKKRKRDEEELQKLVSNLKPTK